MKLVLVLAAMLTSFGASADYFKGGLGYNLSGKAKAESSLGTVDADLDKEFLAPIVLAYGFEMMGDVHGEAEFSYRKTGLDEEGSTSDVTAINGAFNVVGNAPMGSVTLTGGAGFTFGQYDFDESLDKGTAFGLQLFGGVDFPLSNGVLIGGELRYLTTLTKIDLGNDVDGTYNNMAILFNVKFGM